MAHDRKPYENISRVFWIKIELKDYQEKHRQILGDIRDVMSGVRSPIWGLLDIIDFLVPYLEEMGVRISWFWQFMVWMKRKSRINFMKSDQ
jgi:hypothetical protein